MVSEQDKGQSEEAVGDPGPKRYGRMVRMFREGYLALQIYMNVHMKRTFYDIVILRKIRYEGNQKYVRGANLKPQDIPHLEILMQAAKEFLRSVNSL